jgi:hypothetical protein
MPTEYHAPGGGRQIRHLPPGARNLAPPLSPTIVTPIRRVKFPTQQTTDIGAPDVFSFGFFNQRASRQIMITLMIISKQCAVIAFVRGAAFLDRALH